MGGGVASELAGPGPVAGSRVRTHRRTPSDGRLPKSSLDNAVKVLQHHKTPAEKGELFLYLFKKRNAFVAVLAKNKTYK